jgi:hypothetical protein
MFHFNFYFNDSSSESSHGIRLELQAKHPGEYFADSSCGTDGHHCLHLVPTAILLGS